MVDRDEVNAYPPIERVLPHSGAMVLIDEIVDYSDEAIVCRKEVRANDLFVGAEGMDSTISIELMAQTTAAYAGYTGLLRGDEVELGFLLSCRKLELNTNRFPIGGVLDVRAAPTWMGTSRLGAFDCLISSDGQTLAVALLNVLQGSIDPTNGD